MPARSRSDSTPADRRRELASILASAVIRRVALERRVAPVAPGISEESSPGGLEVPAPLPLSVDRRTRG